MALSERENLLRAVHFERPEHIPMSFHVNDACWRHYPQDALQGLMASHPLLFPGFVPSPDPVVPDFDPNARANEPYVDSWSCVWQTSRDGITGTVTGHPLAGWDDFEAFAANAPDPDASDGLGPIDWGRVRRRCRQAADDGRIRRGELTHGHTFMKLCDIRGYENLTFDMADGEPKLLELIRLLEDFNLAVAGHFIEAGVEYMGYPEDLGMQVGPMISPEHFRRYIKPTYERLMAPARHAGCIVHVHSDGDIRSLVDDLIDGGAAVLNLQDLVNGIDWIADKLAGRVCIEIDIDRQQITPHGTPAEIDSLIREEVDKLASREGGLMMIYGLYPGVPLGNVKAVMDAMERYASYYA